MRWLSLETTMCINRLEKYIYRSVPLTPVYLTGNTHTQWIEFVNVLGKLIHTHYRASISSITCMWFSAYDVYG